MAANGTLSYGAPMNAEPESLVLQLLRDMRADMGEMRAEIKSDMHSLRADVTSDLLALEGRQTEEHERTRKSVGEQIVGLRRAVVEYHTSVIGHGVLISELEARLRRVEQHLNLSEPGPH